jgi:NADH dehydrogenase
MAKRTSDGRERPHVVIIGGGFGGLTAAKKLASAPVRVTLVDKTNHHTFQPLLYQVAMAGLSPAEIAQPIRGILHGNANTTVLMASASSIDLAGRAVHLEDGEVLRWDYLIVASGADTSYFGHDQWAAAAPGLKSIEDAIDIRQRVLLAFELAEREESPERKQQLMSFVVIGGGPTGVELAGALAELSRFTLHRDFRTIRPATAKVRLIEAGPRVLAMFPEDLSKRALAQLNQLGVEVRTGARVTAIEPGFVRLGEETIPCSVALWAAGVRATPLTKTLGVPLDRSDRVLVNKDLSIPGHPKAFAIGDTARVDGDDGQPLPGVSPVAMQEAEAVAALIRREVAGRPDTERPPFHYFDNGTMATIGRSRAVVKLRWGIHLSGFIAWLSWLFVHILYLIGFKNRLVVLVVWAWSYLTYGRGARLITGYAPTDALQALRVQQRGEATSRAGDGAPADGAPAEGAPSRPPATPQLHP